MSLRILGLNVPEFIREELRGAGSPGYYVAHVYCRVCGSEEDRKEDRSRRLLCVQLEPVWLHWHRFEI